MLLPRKGETLVPHTKSSGLDHPGWRYLASGKGSAPAAGQQSRPRGGVYAPSAGNPAGRLKYTITQE